ncbi:CoA pyrophosphatase [soil metagenome]
MSVDVNHFIRTLRVRLLGKLPGSEAHEPLRATPTGEVRPVFEHKVPAKPGSVLILLYEEDGKLFFPLTQRADYVGAHGGQVSLPGGKAEPGETIEQTALREAEEEIGVHSDQIEVIGRLSEFFVIPSNFIVTPVIAFHRTPPIFAPDPVEVAKVLHGSIDDLMKDDAISVKEIIAARIYKLNAPHFLLDNQIVWGATAMILNEFRMILQEIRES